MFEKSDCEIMDSRYESVNFYIIFITLLRKGLKNFKDQIKGAYLGPNFSANYIDKSYIKDILDRKILPQKADVDAGTLILFYGRNYLHRVTPVESEKPRILVTLNYNEEAGTMLSENARLTFFGRIN